MGDILTTKWCCIFSYIAIRNEGEAWSKRFTFYHASDPLKKLEPIVNFFCSLSQLRVNGPARSSRSRSVISSRRDMDSKHCFLGIVFRTGLMFPYRATLCCLFWIRSFSKWMKARKCVHMLRIIFSQDCNKEHEEQQIVVIFHSRLKLKWREPCRIDFFSIEDDIWSSYPTT